MIPVALQPEPPQFDKEVRQKGLASLQKKGIDINNPLPPKTDISDLWLKISDDLWDSYKGICAYLCIYIEKASGYCVDHFISKSACPAKAYEWDNYRLSSHKANQKKTDKTGILDPFSMQPDTFTINFASGEIKPGDGLITQYKILAEKTIKELGLNSPDCKRMRCEHYELYLKQKVTHSYLEERSPFVFSEAQRQGLL